MPFATPHPPAAPMADEAPATSRARASDPPDDLAATAAGRALARAWDADTSTDPDGWRPTAPAHGQDQVTALVVQDWWGGDIVCGQAHAGAPAEQSHCWNRLATGVDIDATRSQFTATLTLTPGEVVARAALLADPDTTVRYTRLLQRLAILPSLGLDLPAPAHPTVPLLAGATATGPSPCGSCGALGDACYAFAASPGPDPYATCAKYAQLR